MAFAFLMYSVFLPFSTFFVILSSFFEAKLHVPGLWLEVGGQGKGLTPYMGQGFRPPKVFKNRQYALTHLVPVLEIDNSFSRRSEIKLKKGAISVISIQ